MKRSLTIYVIAAVVVCGIYMSECTRQRLRADRDRLERNQQALLTDIETVTDKYNREVTKVAALELSKKELKAMNTDLAKTVDALNLKVGRLQSMMQTMTRVQDSVSVPLERPVIIDRDSLPPVIRRPFHFEDVYSKIWGEVTLDGTPDGGDARLDLNYSITDTLDVIVYRTPKKFLFIPYGTKRLDCFIYSRNPKATVVAGSCIIRKKK